MLLRCEKNNYASIIKAAYGKKIDCEPKKSK